ncbi:hypothetical protein BD410DRAFT_386606 [Rickenella mellea]|uniref:Uncharacterized protein n=1 Tax=Rickenella mellea TaxID=50990 RepID=A0A4Y7PYX6_9AGAM|nr:hypothetical protein BD410DRAFT_386606 [Rickenella mellea]
MDVNDKRPKIRRLRIESIARFTLDLRHSLRLSFLLFPHLLHRDLYHLEVTLGFLGSFLRPFLRGEQLGLQRLELIGRRDFVRRVRYQRGGQRRRRRVLQQRVRHRGRVARQATRRIQDGVLQVGRGPCKVAATIWRRVCRARRAESVVVVAVVVVSVTTGLARIVLVWSHP